MQLFGVAQRLHRGKVGQVFKRYFTRNTTYHRLLEWQLKNSIYLAVHLRTEVVFQLFIKRIFHLWFSYHTACYTEGEDSSIHC